MAATVQFSESNGAGETVTDGVSNINFGSADLPNLQPAFHPIIQATFSFRKYLRFHLVNLGISTTINTLICYKVSGNYVAGEGIFSNCPNNSSVFMLLSYATPDNTPLIANTDFLRTDTSQGVNCGIAGSTANSLTAPGYANYWVLQLKTTASTPTGALNQKVLAIQYNEF